MVSVEYRNAIAEVLDILKHTNKNDVDKISLEFIKFLNENAAKDYIPNLDHTKRIKDMKLNEKTIGILSIINSKFWCTNEQKKEFDDKLKANEVEYQATMREKYNPDNLFKNKVTQAKNTESTRDMVEYKESLFSRLKNWIKQIFNI